MEISRFKEELRRFDPRLDFTWNGKRSVWQVTGEDARRVRYVIYEVPLGQLDTLGPHIIQGLYDASPTKQGGASALNRLLDERIDRDERAEDRRLSDELGMLAAEAWDHADRIEGRRINNAGVPWVVNDRRRVFMETSDKDITVTGG